MALSPAGSTRTLTDTSVLAASAPPDGARNWICVQWTCVVATESSLPVHCAASEFRPLSMPTRTSGARDPVATRIVELSSRLGIDARRAGGRTTKFARVFHPYRQSEMIAIVINVMGVAYYRTIVTDPIGNLGSRSSQDYSNEVNESGLSPAVNHVIAIIRRRCTRRRGSGKLLNAGHLEGTFFSQRHFHHALSEILAELT